MRRALAAIWMFLNRPLFGTVVTTKETRVDPALFSEDEFPIHCQKCDYALQGLPDGRCPECGTEFVRGRLLVQQYVLTSTGANRNSGWAKATRVFLLISFVLVGVPMLLLAVVYILDWAGVISISEWLRSRVLQTQPTVFDPVSIPLMVSFGVGVVTYLAFILCQGILFLRLRAKGCPIREAIRLDAQQEERQGRST